VRATSAGRLLCLLIGAAVSSAASVAADQSAPARTVLAAAAQAQVPATAAGTADPSIVAADRGRSIYAANCVLCHGDAGKGDGRAAKLYNPRPADLTASTKTDVYKSNIIRKGGAYVGRSMVMPAWGSELSDAQIQDVVAYLRVIARPAG
jgi:mono/diheme cytochrome c family protein